MRILLVVISVFVSSLVFSQKDELDKYYQSQKVENHYVKSKKYKGPKNWQSSYPPNLSSSYYENENVESIDPMDSELSEDELQRNREKKYGAEYGEGVVKKPNPDILPPNPVELPDIELPDIDLPDIDLPNVDFDFPTIGTWEFWKYVLLFIVIAVLLFLLYLMLKRINPSDSKVRLDVEDEWNPTVITKSELELKLESAILGSNYRECVRIHFMFILKELIAKKHIDWKPEKTNYDYLLEVRKSKGYDDFAECVRIYDLIWYGDYEISRQNYDGVRPTLESYYQSLNPEK